MNDQLVSKRIFPAGQLPPIFQKKVTVNPSCLDGVGTKKQRRRQSGT